MSGFPLSIALFFAFWSGLFIGLWAQSGFAGIGVASALSALVVIGDEVCKVIRYHAWITASVCGLDGVRAEMRRPK